MADTAAFTRRPRFAAAPYCTPPPQEPRGGPLPLPDRKANQRRTTPGRTEQADGRKSPAPFPRTWTRLLIHPNALSAIGIETLKGILNNVFQVLNLVVCKSRKILFTLPLRECAVIPVYHGVRLDLWALEEVLSNAIQPFLEPGLPSLKLTADAIGWQLDWTRTVPVVAVARSAGAKLPFPEQRMPLCSSPTRCT